MANYIGNQDFRGWVAADPNKAWMNDYVGNDGGYDATRLSDTQQYSINDAYAVYSANKNIPEFWGLDASVPAGEAGSSMGSVVAGGSTYTAPKPAYDPNEAALYDQAIGMANGQLGSLDQQKDVGFGNISNAYNTALQRLLNAKGIADRDYGVNRQQTIDDNVTQRSNIDMSVGRNTNALQRLLGQWGSGFSSASRIAAPYATASVGTQQRNQVDDTYAQNLGTLETQYGDYNNSWEEQKQEAGNQKFQQEQALNSEHLSNRNSLLQKLATLVQQKAQLIGGNPVTSGQSYIDEINANNGKIAQFGNQYANKVNVTTPDFKAPDLSKYTYERPTIGADQNAMTQTASPYLQMLLNKKKELNY